MLGLPNGFPDENGERHMSNQTPLSSHFQPEFPESGNLPAGGGSFYPPEHPFNSAHDYELNFPFHVSGTQPFDVGHHFMHPSTSGMYVAHAAGNMITSPSELLSLPSVSRVI
jgi:hypothetical protein